MPRALRKNSPVFFESRDATVTNPRVDTPARRIFGFAGCARNRTLPSGSVNRPNACESPSIAVFVPLFFKSAIVRFRSFVMKPIPVTPPIILAGLIHFRPPLWDRLPWGESRVFAALRRAQGQVAPLGHRRSHL